jgi:hypothetical protein
MLCYYVAVSVPWTATVQLNVVCILTSLLPPLSIRSIYLYLCLHSATSTSA